MADEKKTATLAPPAVTALRQGAAGSPGQRQNMERTVSQDMRNERADLKEAAEHSLNIIMDLDLEGKIRYVSPSWSDVIGTLPNQVTGKPILDVICNGGDSFAEAIESVRKDDSRSHIARFTVQLGPHSILRQRRPKPTLAEGQESIPRSPTNVPEEEQEEQFLNVEAQGIMVYDRTTGAESHVRIHPRSHSHPANLCRPCGWCDPRSSEKSPLIFQRSLLRLSVWEQKSSPTT